MTWQTKAMKDVVSSDMLRGVANKLWSGDFRMGKPIQGNTWISYSEYIGVGGETGGIETSKYPQEKKPKGIPRVAASEKGTG